MGSATVFTYLSNLCNSRVASLFLHPWEIFPTGATQGNIRYLIDHMKD